MSDKNGKSAFEELLADVESMSGLTKSFGESDSADDEKIAAAEREGEEGDEDDESLTKSYTLKDEETGEERQFVDASDLLKAMQDTINEQGEQLAALKPSVVKVLGAQNALIKSLVGQVGDLHGKLNELSGQGRGRKSVLTIAERPEQKAEEIRKSIEGDTMNGQEFLAKCDALFSAGKLTGIQISMAEACINAGQQPPKEVIQAVAASLN